jgi:hypothetical protein
MKNTKELKPYVICGPYGVEYIGLHNSEESCWSVFLGWPPQSEIDWYKEKGYYCVEATLTWRKLK